MSDSRLRGLELRWLETGAVADEAAWLSERVRVGQVVPERLQLAAACGHAGAKAATGFEGEPLVSSILGAPSARYRDHVGSPLLLAGREACARFAAAVARRAIEGRASEWHRDGRPLAGVVALERVIVERRFQEPFDGLQHKALFASALSGELRAVVSSEAHDALRTLHYAFGAVEDFCWSERILRIDPDSGGHATEAIWKKLHAATSAARAVGLEGLEEAVRDDVAPWALRLSDPLAERLGRASSG